MRSLIVILIDAFSHADCRATRNTERIFPYLGGEEINTHPQHAHHRWVIDFNDFPLRRQEMDGTWLAMWREQRATCRRVGLVPLDYPEPVAEDWPDLSRIVQSLVKPERDVQKRDALRERWWQFADKRPGMRAAIVKSGDFHVLSNVSSHHGVTTIKSGTLCGHTVVVFADSGPTLRGQLQSRPHELWAAFFASSLGDGLRYTPSDCFETFPFPSSQGQVGAVGAAYHQHRAALMVARNEGMTRIYNRFHDPSERAADIQRLRDLHHALDEAVLRAYGWDDLAETAAPVFLSEDDDPEYHYQGRLFWPAPFRYEVLARLLAENAERAALEHALGRTPLRPDFIDEAAE